MSPQSEKAIRLATIAALIKRLNFRAKEPERVGTRVILADWLLKHELHRETQAQLAKRLRLSKSRLSEALADVEGWLLDAHNTNSSWVDPGSDVKFES